MTDAKPSRLALLDIFRGTAVAGMIVVTSPGDWNHSFSWLRHAPWDGWTLADMVFPGFLFAVGMALGLSFPRTLSVPGAAGRLWLRVARRAAALIVIGLLVNALYTADILGIPVYIGQPGLAHVRIPGVLQRIAFCYVIAFALIMVFPRRTGGGQVDVNPRAILAAIMVLLAGYWLLMRFVPVPGYGVGRLDQEGNLASFIDRAVFTVPHMWNLGSIEWKGPVVFDPEGLLSTLPAITNVLFGVLAARVWQRLGTRMVPGLIVSGIGLMAGGLLLDPIFPINKLIWTSSFALLSSGFSALALAFFAIALRSQTVGRLFTPLRVLGTNAVLAFVLSIVMTKFSGAPWFRWDGVPVTAQAWGFALARSVIPDETWAATACALAVLVVITLLLWPLHRRAIHFRL